MRVGDSYKIKSLHEAGVSDEDIVHQFRNEYSEEEIMGFIPKPKKKRGRPKKVVEPDTDESVNGD